MSVQEATLLLAQEATLLLALAGKFVLFRICPHKVCYKSCDIFFIFIHSTKNYIAKEAQV